jgi:MFS family permease
MKLSKTVVYLGFTSLFCDVATESIYSLLPIFLTQSLGASTLFVGLIEGVAESIASLTKFISGYYSDKKKNKADFVLAGYTLSNLVKPLMGFAMAPWHVFALRQADRIGKGVRNSPRDAWLASETTPGNRGKVFGFERSMDHTGAFIGPLLATIYLYFYPGQYRTLFLLTIIPGAISIFFTVLARQQSKNQTVETVKKETIKIPLLKMPRQFLNYMAILFLFTLGNSSDAFIILKIKQFGIADFWIPLVWMAHNGFKMVLATWGGGLSDKYGRAKSIVAGWLIYALVYLLFGWSTHLYLTIFLFMAYGLFYILTEASEKALIADLIEPDHQATAYGMYNFVVGICALPASLMAGFLWQKISPSAPFYFGAVLSFISVSMFLVLVKPKPPI